MSTISRQKLEDHEKYLKKDLFFTENKWPQFNLLFKDIKKLSKKIPLKSKVVFLERNLLYGGYSLFAPFFYKNNVISIDCSMKEIKKRGSYNLRFLKNPKILKYGSKISNNYKKIKLKNNYADLIIVPNLMHHVNDYNIFLKECYRVLKKGGQIYVFEPTFREVHQDPEDFFRFTPNSFKVGTSRSRLSRFNSSNSFLFASSILSSKFAIPIAMAHLEYLSGAAGIENSVTVGNSIALDRP